MTAISVLPSFPSFFDKQGRPLEAGKIYIGAAGASAQSSPIATYWDKALTITAAQPIRTVGGYPSRNGSAAVIYTAVPYSITVTTVDGSLVYSTREPTISLPEDVVVIPEVVATVNLLDVGQSNCGGSAEGISSYWPTDARVKTAVLGSGLVATSGLLGVLPYNTSGSLNPGAVMCEEIAKAKECNVNHYISWQGATSIAAWAGSAGLVVFNVSFDAGVGTAFALGQTITWNGGLDGPAYVVNVVSEAGATGSLVLAMATGKRLFDNTAIVSSAGKTANINGDPVEEAFPTATSLIRFASGAGAVSAGQTMSWTGGTATVLYAYDAVTFGALIVEVTTGTAPVASTAFSTSGGKSGTTSGAPVNFNLRWTISGAYDAGSAGTLNVGDAVTWTTNLVPSTGILTDATNGTTGTISVEVRTGYAPRDNSVLTCGTKTVTLNGTPSRTNRPKWAEVFDLIEENAVTQFDAFTMDHGEAGYDWTNDEYKAAMLYLYEAAKELGTSADTDRFFPFIPAGLYNGPKSGQQGYRTSTIEEFARENPGWCAMASSENLEGRDDTPADPNSIVNHLTNAGYREKGIRRARAFLNLFSGQSNISDQRLLALGIPGVVNNPGTLGIRSLEQEDAVTASAQYLIKDKKYLGQTYNFTGTITITLDGDANKLLGDGGLGFEFYTSLNTDVITFDGDGRSCILMGSGVAASTVQVSGIGRGRVVYQGSRWIVFFTANTSSVSSQGFLLLSTDIGATLIVTTASRVLHTGTITADRTVNISASAATAGDVVRVTRSGAGAFNLAVRDQVSAALLKNLTTGTWCECVFDGTNWKLFQYGSL